MSSARKSQRTSTRKSSRQSARTSTRKSTRNSSRESVRKSARLSVRKPNAKRKRFTPAKSAAAESGLVRFTTLLEDTPSAKLAKLVENPLYTSTNMTTIKNYLKMKGMKVTGRKQELVERMHAQILKEKANAYGPPADLNDDGRTLRSETAAYMAAVRTGLTDDEDDGNNAGDQDSDSDDGADTKPKRLTFGAALATTAEDEDEDDDEESSARPSPFLPSRIEPPATSLHRETENEDQDDAGYNDADEDADDEDFGAVSSAADDADVSEAVSSQADAAPAEPIVLKHHVVDVTNDPPYHSWHFPKITLVFFIVTLLLLRAVHSCGCFEVLTPAQTETTAGWLLILGTLNIVYLSANAS